MRPFYFPGFESAMATEQNSGNTRPLQCGVAAYASPISSATVWSHLSLVQSETPARRTEDKRRVLSRCTN